MRPAGAGGPVIGPWRVADVGGARTAVARMDPRISARRIAVRRDEGRRRLRRLAWLGGAVAVVALALGSTRTPLLDVDHIDVHGLASGDDAARAALAAAGVRAGAPLIDLDLAGAEAALESLPGVARAEVRRRWPGTVEVRVTPRTPVAIVHSLAGDAVVGADGVVVAAGADAAAVAAGLVAVDGPAGLAPGDRFTARPLLLVAEALPAALRGPVASVGASDDEGAVELRLHDGAIVRLGAADQLGAKLVAVATVLEQVDTGCLAVLDVRVPAAPTVTRVPGC